MLRKDLNEKDLNDVADIFWLKVKAYQEKAHLDKEGLALAFDISRQTFAKYEREKRKPTLDMIVRLAGLWDVSVSELLKVDRTETVEERRKRMYLQEVWEVHERYYGDKK